MKNSAFLILFLFIALGTSISTNYGAEALKIGVEKPLPVGGPQYPPLPPIRAGGPQYPPLPPIRVVGGPQYPPLPPIRAGGPQYPPLPPIRAGGPQYSPLPPIRAAGGPQYPPLPPARAGGPQYPPLPPLQAAGGPQYPPLPPVRAAGGPQYPPLPPYPFSTSHGAETHKMGVEKPAFPPIPPFPFPPFSPPTSRLFRKDTNPPNAHTTFSTAPALSPSASPGGQHSMKAASAPQIPVAASSRV